MNDNIRKNLWPQTQRGRWMSEDFEPGLVSVIVPTYNRAGLIVESLRSVWAQTYRPVEILVIDDGSTDKTREIVEEWGREHADYDRFYLRYLHQTNAGAPAARNLGLIESRGEYIQFLDSDDLLHPKKFQKQVANLAEDGALDYVYSGTGKFGETIDWDSTPYAGLPVPSGQMLASFLRGGMWNTISGIYRRSACVDLGPWNESAPIYQDWDYNIRFILGRPNVKHVEGTLSLARAIGRMDDKNRITGNSKSEMILKAFLSLNIKWERLIRNAGRLNKEVEWALAQLRYYLTVKALRQGFLELARESVISGSHLSNDPALRNKILVWRYLVHLPQWYSSKLSWAIFAVLDTRNSIRRRLGHNRKTPSIKGSITEGLNCSKAP